MEKPPFTSHPKITSEELLLRKLELSDIPQLLPISYYDGEAAATEAEAIEMLRKIEQDYLKGDSIHWGIEEKSSGTITGTCGYYRGFKNASGELGFVMLPEYQGKGYMTAALRLAIAFGFRIGLSKIFAVTTSENLKAVKLLERLHFDRSTNLGKEITFEISREGLYSIRKYRPEDQQQILNLIRSNTPANFHHSEEEELKNYLDMEAEHYFVAEGLGVVLAAGGYDTGFDYGKTVRISWDLAHPEFQGLGIGKQLTKFRISEIEKIPEVQKILVRTTLQAEKFYEKQGFQKKHFEKDFWAPGFDLCEMEMRIN